MDSNLEAFIERGNVNLRMHMPKLLEKLTPEQTVEVARDVLEQMYEGNLDLQNQHFITKAYGRIEYWEEDSDPKKIQEDIPLVLKHCTCCARGAMVMSAIHLFDGVSRLPDNNAMCSASFAMFEDAQLIEKAFQWATYSNEDREGLSPVNGEKYPGEKFGVRFFGHKVAMIAIMLNVILHKGRFNPADIKSTAFLEKYPDDYYRDIFAVWTTSEMLIARVMQ